MLTVQTLREVAERARQDEAERNILERERLKPQANELVKFYQEEILNAARAQEYGHTCYGFANLQEGKSVSDGGIEVTVEKHSKVCVHSFTVKPQFLINFFW